ENAGTLAQASVYGSILPATWSLMLALRARGLGSAWTTLHIMYEQDAARLLDIPEHVTQTALLPVAYYKGSDFKPAKRISSTPLVHWNGWGGRHPAGARGSSRPPPPPPGRGRPPPPPRPRTRPPPPPCAAWPMPGGAWRPTRRSAAPC